MSHKEKEGIINPFGLWRYGNNYYHAAIAVYETYNDSKFMPFYFLIRQSISNYP